MMPFISKECNLPPVTGSSPLTEGWGSEGRAEVKRPLELDERREDFLSKLTLRLQADIVVVNSKRL